MVGLRGAVGAAVVALLGCLIPLSVRAEANVPSRAPAGWIHDEAGLLPPDEREELARWMETVHADRDLQLAVITLREADGEEPKAIAVRALNAWNAGRRSALLLVLLSPRKLYVQPGTDLAERLDGDTSSGICASVVAPKLRAHNAPGAIRAGLEAIVRRVAPISAIAAPRAPFRPEKPNPSPEELQRKLESFSTETGPGGAGLAPEPARPEPPFRWTQLLYTTPLVIGAWVLALIWRSTRGGVWWKKRCARCASGMEYSRRVVQSATESSAGSGEKVFRCQSCSYGEVIPYLIPMIAVSNSSNSDSWGSSSWGSDSSSSSSDSSSSSGGGGGGSDW